MTDRTYQVLGRQDVRYYMGLMVAVEMTPGDTVTVGDFINTKNIAAALIVSQSDGSILANTISNNQVTLTGGAGTNIRIILLMVGIKA